MGEQEWLRMWHYWNDWAERVQFYEQYFPKMRKQITGKTHPQEFKADE